MLKTALLTAIAGDLRSLTHVTPAILSTSFVRVRTQDDQGTAKSWRREPFFAWLDRRCAELGIKTMQALADLCGPALSHSALSNWRSGKWRPTMDKLRVLAGPLQVPEETVLYEAGMLPAVPEEDRGIAMIATSGLPDAAKAMLLDMYQEDVRRARTELERQLQAKIDLMQQK